MRLGGAHRPDRRPARDRAGHLGQLERAPRRRPPWTTATCSAPSTSSMPPRQAFPDNLTVRKAVAGGYVARRPRQGVAGPLQDHPHAGRQRGRLPGRRRRRSGRQRQELRPRSGSVRPSSAFPAMPPSSPWPPAMSRPAATTSAPPTTSAPRWPPCPPASPTDRLAHVLVYPDQDTSARRAVTAADLQHLLDPNYEPFAKTTKIPALPAYGSDPYNGSAPVIVTPPQALQTPTSSLGPDPLAASPAYTQSQTAAPVYVPQSFTRPRTQNAGQQMHRAENSNSGPYPRYASASYSEPRLVYATLQVEPRARLRSAYSWLRPASFVVRAAPSAVHAAPKALPAAALEPKAPQPQAPPQSGVPQVPASPQTPPTLKPPTPGKASSSRSWPAIATLKLWPRSTRSPPMCAPSSRPMLNSSRAKPASISPSATPLRPPHISTEWRTSTSSIAATRPAGLELQHAWLLFNLRQRQRALFRAPGS